MEEPMLLEHLEEPVDMEIYTAKGTELTLLL
jgi:hypothetical protein